MKDAISSSKIVDSKLRFELRFHAVVIALEFGEYNTASKIARLNVIEHPQNLGYWNLYGRVISFSGPNPRHQRFLARLLKEDYNNFAANLLAAHCGMSSDISTISIGELTIAHQKDAQNPLVLLCLGIGFLLNSMNRNVKDRQQDVVKAFALNRGMDCDDIRKDAFRMEGWYNMGRAHQQLGLFHLAIPMYERVLRASRESNKFPEYAALCREAAYNLSLIYRNKYGIICAHSYENSHFCFS